MIFKEHFARLFGSIFALIDPASVGRVVASPGGADSIDRAALDSLLAQSLNDGQNVCAASVHDTHTADTGSDKHKRHIPMVCGRQEHQVEMRV